MKAGVNVLRFAFILESRSECDKRSRNLLDGVDPLKKLDLLLV